MKHIKTVDQFLELNEQLFGKYASALDSFLGDKEISESPIEGELIIKPSISMDKSKNAQAIIDALNRHGIKNPYTQKAILGVIGKESGFIPQNETTYSNTPAERIKKIFKSKLGSMSDSSVDSLKKNDKLFFDTIYGGKFGNGKDEGYKYRGRGFNQITFKGNYQKIQELFDKIGKLEKKVNIVSNPDLLNELDVASEAAVLYFLDRSADPRMSQKYGVKDLNSFKDQDTALKAMVNANAGWGKDIGNDYLDSLDKAKKQAEQFDIKDLKRI